MKQLVPTSIEEYIAEHKEKDLVSGRVIEVQPGYARVELGEGIQGRCQITAPAPAQEEKSAAAKDLSSLSSMLQARWKGGTSSKAAKPEALQQGQIRSFRIRKLDQGTKKIELELAQ